MIAVVGAGGVGGFLSAALALAGHPVTVVAPEPTAELIDREGIRVTSPLLGDALARPRAVAVLDEPAHALLVAVKAPVLPAALARVRAAPGLVVPLLNGVEHMAVVRERLPGRVAAGTIRIESERPRPGVVVHTSPAVRLHLAADDPALREPLLELAEVLRDAGPEVSTGGSEATALWSKLARLCPLALTTSAADLPLGAIRSDPARRRELLACAAEAVAAARAEGAAVELAAPLAELEAAPAGLGSSMRRDLAAGRPTELDAIAGAVLRAGARHRLGCPVTARLAARVAARERAAVPPPP